jgi:hypothetical protein
MESKAEAYRRKADEAEKNAGEARDVAVERMWRQVAEQWRQMAIRQEREAANFFALCFAPDATGQGYVRS